MKFQNLNMTERLFAIGDIHGCYPQFRELVELKIQINKNDTLVLIGDYIDRGFQSKEVIDYIIDLQQEGFNIIPLLGNHEATLLNVLENEEVFPKWIQNGGSETMHSFGIKSLKGLDRRYLDFFKGLPFYYVCNNFLFVHAGFNDELVNPFDDTYEMLWTRREKYANPLFAGKTIIHGHTPITETQCQYLVTARAQAFNIDTGCVYSDKEGYGLLTALELYSYNLFSV
jgi:serine/threonine protein phosphatase 1